MKGLLDIGVGILGLALTGAMFFATLVLARSAYPALGAVTAMYALLTLAGTIYLATWGHDGTP